MPTLTITEHQASVIAGIQVLRLKPIAKQTVAIGAVAASSAPFSPGTRAIRVHTDTACRITGGMDATVDDMALSANQTEYFDITECGGFLSVIAY